jgi:hypothetical protein
VDATRRQRKYASVLKENGVIFLPQYVEKESGFAALEVLTQL